MAFAGNMFIDMFSHSGCCLAIYTFSSVFLRSFYRGALSMVLQQQSTPGQQEGEEGRDGVSPVAAELVAMMSGDWEKSVLEADMFWVALHLAR